MSKDDFKSGPEPNEGDSLSATAMFLRAFDSKAAPTQEPSTKPATGDWPVEHVLPSAPVTPAADGTGPGEFTRMFKAFEQEQAQTPPFLTPQTPTPLITSSPAPKPESPAPPASAPGEFTRIFVPAATPLSSPPITQVTRIAPDTPIPAPVPNPSRMKGFSSPGVSDSASAEGSFTQFFKTAPSAPTPAPPQPAQAHVPSPAQSFSEKPWEPVYGAAEPALSSQPFSGGATGLMASLGSPSNPPPVPRPPDPPLYRPEPSPSFSSPPQPADNSGIEAGSVTRLIRQLSEVRETPPAEPVPAVRTPNPPPAGLEPGEFTRMISADAVRANLAAPAPPVAAQPAAPPAPVPSFAAPAPPPIKLAAPVLPKPATPTLEPPKIAEPKLAPPALAAPKSKLEGMVPILLIVNTFLLLVLLLVVIFSLKSR